MRSRLVRHLTARVLTLAWAAFWLWFGMGWAVHEHLPWYRIALSAFQPGLLFFALAAIGWIYPRWGGALLVLVGFALASWYGIYFGHMPTATKLFVLATIALPPLVSGLLLLWSGQDSAGKAHAWQ